VGLWGSTRRNGALLLAVTMAAGGCWPASGAGPDRRAHNESETVISTASVASMGEAWTARFGPGPVSDPVRWAANGPVYVLANDADHGARSVYAVGADGSVSWELDGQAGGTDQHFAGELIVDGNELGISSRDLDSEPEDQWSHQRIDVRTTDPIGARWRGRLETRRGDTVLAVGLNDANRPHPFTLFGRTLDGFERWGGYVGSDVAPTLGRIRHYQPGYGMTDTYYPPGFGNGVRSYPNMDQGTNCVSEYMCPIWAVPIDGQTATPVVLGIGEQTVYTVSDVGTVFALDNTAGARVWTASLGSTVSRPPALAGDWLYVPSDDGRLAVFAADGCGAPTCTPVWSAETGSRISAQPAVGGDVVFAATADGGLHAFPAAGCGAATCPDLWSTDLGSEITGAPAVSDGRLYVGTDDGRLIAFEPQA
jgi:outer membrane protein assembly factor BamB